MARNIPFNAKPTARSVLAKGLVIRRAAACKSGARRHKDYEKWNRKKESSRSEAAKADQPKHRGNGQVGAQFPWVVGVCRIAPVQAAPGH